MSQRINIEYEPWDRSREEAWIRAALDLVGTKSWVRTRSYSENWTNYLDWSGSWNSSGNGSWDWNF